MPHRFKLDWAKCLEGIHLLVERMPGITPFYVAKVFYFADKEHLLDFGRPISGDRYVAMNNGPVPSAIYDIIKQNEFLEDWIVDEFTNRICKVGLKMTPKLPFVARALSRSDQEYLISSLNVYGHMTFGALTELSHKEKGWRDAWERLGINNEMDPFAVIPEDFGDRNSFINEIKEKAAYA